MPDPIAPIRSGDYLNPGYPLLKLQKVALRNALFEHKVKFPIETSKDSLVKALTDFFVEKGREVVLAEWRRSKTKQGSCKGIGDGVTGKPLLMEEEPDENDSEGTTEGQQSTEEEEELSSGAIDIDSESDIDETEGRQSSEEEDEPSSERDTDTDSEWNSAHVTGRNTDDEQDNEDSDIEEDDDNSNNNKNDKSDTDTDSKGDSATGCNDDERGDELQTPNYSNTTTSSVESLSATIYVPELHPALDEVNYTLGEDTAWFGDSPLAKSKVSGESIIDGDYVRVLHLHIDEQDCFGCEEDYNQKLDIIIENKTGITIGDIFSNLAKK